MSLPPASDPLIEISAQEVRAEREMLFGGNFNGGSGAEALGSSLAGSRGIRLQTGNR